MSLSWSNLLIGRPVANREAEGRKLGVLTGVSAMGLGGLGSASYGPEAALTILAATGAAGLGVTGPITGVILLIAAGDPALLLLADHRRLSQQQRLPHRGKRQTSWSGAPTS